MGRIVRVADHAAGAGMTCAGKAEVLASGLAGDGTSGVENTRHDRGIEFGDVTFEQRRTIHHGNAGDADVVLDRDLLAAQQSFGSSLNIRLPVPGAVRIFGCRRPIPRRSRRNRRQGWRHQFVQPGVRSQRSLEGLLKGSNLFGGENKTEVRSEVIDLVQRRKANCHDPSPISRLFGKQNEQSHPRPEKAPNGINAAVINGRVGYGAERNWEVVTQTSSAAQELFRDARIHVPSYCVLASPALSMQSQHLFYADSTNDAQRRLTIQGSKA